MSTYEIHGPLLTGNREAAAEALEATKVGFSVVAFVFAPVWLAWRRLWLALAVYLVGAVIALSLMSSGLIDPVAVFALALTAGLFVGLEGSNWRSRSLERRGRPLRDLVEASNANDAAYLFIARRLAGPEASASVFGAREARAAQQPHQAHVLGLFPEARRP